MKSISQLNLPELRVHAVERKMFRQPRYGNLLAVGFYCAFGFWLCIDIGFAPWNWQFSMVFLPLFIATEWAWRIIGFHPVAETSAGA